MSPTTAIREGSAAVEVRGRWWLRALILAVGLVSGGMGEGFGRRSISTVLVLLGAVLLVPFVVQPVARVVGRLTHRLAGGAGSIAVMHLVKERSRSAYTLGLVMVVLAMLIAVAGTNAAMANTLDSIIDRQTGGSVQVGSPGAFDPVGGRRPSARSTAPARSPRSASGRPSASSRSEAPTAASRRDAHGRRRSR